LGLGLGLGADLMETTDPTALTDLIDLAKRAGWAGILALR